MSNGIAISLTVIHGIVPLIAACSYFAMATGQGAIFITSDVAAAGRSVGRIFYWARYVDWTFTTPLLLTTLSLTAMRHMAPKRHGALVGVILADVMMIVTAFAFGLSETPALKWTWFIISCAAFLGVYYVLFVPLMEASAAEREETRANYRRNVIILSLVWLIYPIVLAVAPDGLNVIGDAASVFCIAVLDVIAKVIYGITSTVADTKATDSDMRDPVPTHAPPRPMAVA